MPQTQLERDAEHSISTRDLLLEVLETQKIPNNVAIAALCTTLTRVVWNESASVGIFIDTMKECIARFDQSIPIYLSDQLSDIFNSSLSDVDSISTFLKLIQDGPYKIQIKDGKAIKP